MAWQPSRPRGQSSGDAVSAAALTGPRAAAQTGVPLRPLVREPVVAWTPRRQRLGGVLMAQPWTTVAWALGPRDRTTLPLLAAGAAARSLRHAGPGWQRRLRPCARCESALHIATDRRRRGGCQAGCPPTPDPASAPAVAGERPLPCVARPLCPLVWLRKPWP